MPISHSPPRRPRGQWNDGGVGGGGGPSGAGGRGGRGAGRPRVTAPTDRGGEPRPPWVGLEEEPSQSEWCVTPPVVRSRRVAPQSPRLFKRGAGGRGLGPRSGRTVQTERVRPHRMAPADERAPFYTRPLLTIHRAALRGVIARTGRPQRDMRDGRTAGTPELKPPSAPPVQCPRTRTC